MIHPNLFKTALTGLFLGALMIPARSAEAASGEALKYHGIASWYSSAEALNRRTASGELFDDKKMTCATYHYPFGTYLKITNIANGKSVICRVNDRGPRRSLRRSVDLTKTSFRKLAPTRHGLIKVRIAPVEPVRVDAARAAAVSA